MTAGLPIGYSGDALELARAACIVGGSVRHKWVCRIVAHLGSSVRSAQHGFGLVSRMIEARYERLHGSLTFLG